MSGPLLLLGGLLLALAAPGARGAGDSASAGLDELMASARYWRQHQRSDLAKGIVEKILKIDPQHAAALGLLDQIDGRPKPAASQPRPAAQPRRSLTAPPRKTSATHSTAAPTAAAPAAASAPLAIASPSEVEATPPVPAALPSAEPAAQPSPVLTATVADPPPISPPPPPSPSASAPAELVLRPWHLTRIHADLGWRTSADGTSTLRSARAGLRLAQIDGPAWLSLERLTLDAGRYRTPTWSGNLLGQATQAQAVDIPQQAAATKISAGTQVDLGAVEADALELGLHDGPIPDFSARWSRRLLRTATRTLDLELARRPMTGTLLSWLGATDPVSGQRWGAVSQNALTLSVDESMANDLTGSLSLRAGQLSGHGVRDNPHLQIRATLDRPLQRLPNWQLDGGLVGNFWSFAHNDSFSTWGQSGTWSPQRYLSLGARLRLRTELGTGTRLDARAGISRSFTDEAATPWYPTDPQLQAASGDPYHAGGPGGGVGGSLQLGAEHPLAGWLDGWLFATRLELERSTDYSPNRLSVELVRR